MNIGGLVGALLPVFFVMALGYMAGKRNTFDADQAAGLSRLALGFALPASLFVRMADIRKDLLLQQGPLVLALLLAHVGLFLVSWLVLRRIESLRGAPSIIFALLMSSSRAVNDGMNHRAVYTPCTRTVNNSAQRRSHL